MSLFLTAVLSSTQSSTQPCLLVFLSLMLDLGVCHGLGPFLSEAKSLSAS